MLSPVQRSRGFSVKNVVGAVIYHYFEIGSDLSLHHVLALETRLVDLYTDSDDGVIERSLEWVSPLEIKLTAELKRSRVKTPPEKLGEVTLRRSQREAPFRVAERRV